VKSSFTPHESWYGKSASLKYFKIFGCKYFIKRDEDNLSSFLSNFDEGILLGYSTHNKAYRCFK
jgi:hypothetical protein